MHISIALPALLFALAAASGFAVYRRLATWSLTERCLAAVLPLIATECCVRAATLILNAAGFAWNDMRLARAVAFWRGYSIFPGRDADAPIIGTLHAPLTQLFYAPLGMLDNPTLALTLGSALSCALAIGPLTWLLLRAAPAARSRRQLLFGIFVLAACVLAIEHSPSLRYSAFNIHTDAGAFGLATLAGILYRKTSPRTWTPLLLAALFAAASVWSKQTMAPLLVALPLFLWVFDGFPRALRFVLCLLPTGAVVSAAMFALFGPPRALWFNIVTMAVQMPSKESGDLQALTPYADLIADALPSLMIVGFLFLATLAARPHSLKQQRWLLFFVIGACLIPTSVTARETMGGYINHISLFSYFVLLSAATGLMHFFDGDARSGLALPHAAKIFAVLLVALNLDPSADLLLVPAIARAGFNPTQQAYDFDLEHPGEAYFPANPLAALLAEGKLYHSDYALFDREIRGYDLTDAQFRAGLPPQFHAVAFPPAEIPVSRAVRGLLVPMHPSSGPGFENWKVWASINADGP